MRSTAQESLRLLNTPEVPPGVYRLANHTPPGPILTTITDWGWYAGTINGRVVNDKQTFLDAAGQALLFPKYYGRNWDAFEEMVNDLSWIKAKGAVLLYDGVYHFAANQPEVWQTALSILQSACSHSQHAGIPLYVLLRHSWRWNRQVPRLAA